MIYKPSFLPALLDFVVATKANIGLSGLTWNTRDLTNKVVIV